MNSSNGRVDIKTPNTSTLFEMYDKIPAHQCTTFRNPTEGLWDDSNLSRSYFSRENIQILQNGIRAGVYHKSNGQYTIGPQDCDSLKIVMRSVFLQNASNQSTNITKQNLNKKATKPSPVNYYKGLVLKRFFVPVFLVRCFSFLVLWAFGLLGLWAFGGLYKKIMAQ